MKSRLRSRPLTSVLSFGTREAARGHRLRLFAGLTVAATLVGGASAGLALNQEPDQPVGLQGIWPEFTPDALSTDSFGRLGGNWDSWAEAAAQDVGELYTVADKNVEQQREALAKVESRVRVLRRAIGDPAYSMIRDDLTSIYVPLQLRTELFRKSLDLLTADLRPSAGSARVTAVVEVKNALSSLESDLRSVPNGAAWLPYVRADEVRKSLDTPDAREALEPLAARLDANAEGRNAEQKKFLNRPSFRRLRTAVLDQIGIDRVAEEGAGPALREGLAALSEAIDAHEDSPTDETARDIRDAQTALRRAAGPMYADLDELIRRNYFNYNLRIVADAPFVSKLVATNDIKCGPVRDYFMGAQIYGNQRTNANVDLQFVPSETEARFTLNLAGQTASRTTAYTNEATVNSVGSHGFYAVKPITFDGDQFLLGPADLSVNPNIRHVGISTKYDNIFFGLFKGMIRRKAFQEANSRLPAGRAHAADELREKILPEFNGEVDQQFGEMNHDLAAFEGRMQRLGVRPRAERTRTTSERFLLDAAVRGSDELSGSPPNVGSTRGVGFTMQIHESLLNNTADRWGFAGRRMTDREVRAELQAWFSDLLGRSVTFEDDGSNKEPTVLIFHDTDPIRFQVENGAVVMILRAGLVQEDGEEIPAQIVEVPLDITVDGNGITLTRGTIIVSPVDPPRNRALQITRAGVMRRKLEQAIEGGTRDGVIDIERDGKSPIQVRIQRIDARGGWLTVYGA